MKKNMNMGKVTKWYYDLARIMKQAHQIFKRSRLLSFSHALKYAWAQAKREAKTTMRKMEDRKKDLEKEARKIIDAAADILCDDEDRTESIYKGSEEGKEILKEEKKNNARIVRTLLDMNPRIVVDKLSDVVAPRPKESVVSRWHGLVDALEEMGVWA